MFVSNLPLLFDWMELFDDENRKIVFFFKNFAVLPIIIMNTNELIQ